MRQSTKELLKLKTDIPKGTCYGQRPLTSRQLAKKYTKDRYQNGVVTFCMDVAKND